jgi:hypothetical protein
MQLLWSSLLLLRRKVVGIVKETPPLSQVLALLTDIPCGSVFDGPIINPASELANALFHLSFCCCCMAGVWTNLQNPKTATRGNAAIVFRIAEAIKKLESKESSFPEPSPM